MSTSRKSSGPETPPRKTSEQAELKKTPEVESKSAGDVDQAWRECDAQLKRLQTEYGVEKMAFERQKIPKDIEERLQTDGFYQDLKTGIPNVGNGIELAIANAVIAIAELKDENAKKMYSEQRLYSVVSDPRFLLVHLITPLINVLKKAKVNTDNLDAIEDRDDVIKVINGIFEKRYQKIGTHPIVSDLTDALEKEFKTLPEQFSKIFKITSSIGTPKKVETNASLMNEYAEYLYEQGLSRERKRTVAEIRKVTEDHLETINQQVNEWQKELHGCVEKAKNELASIKEKRTVLVDEIEAVNKQINALVGELSMLSAMVAVESRTLKIESKSEGIDVEVKAMIGDLTNKEEKHTTKALMSDAVKLVEGLKSNTISMGDVGRFVTKASDKIDRVKHHISDYSNSDAVQELRKNARELETRKKMLYQVQYAIYEKLKLILIDNAPFWSRLTGNALNVNGEKVKVSSGPKKLMEYILHQDALDQERTDDQKKQHAYVKLNALLKVVQAMPAKKKVNKSGLFSKSDTNELCGIMMELAKTNDMTEFQGMQTVATKLEVFCTNHKLQSKKAITPKNRP